MRKRSRELRELMVRVLAGVGLVLALAVMGAVLVSSAVTDDRDDRDNAVALPPGAGFGEGAPTAKGDDLANGTSDPSHSGVLFGAVLLTGGFAVLGWGARRPKPEPAHGPRLQPILD